MGPVELVGKRTSYNNCIEERPIKHARSVVGTVDCAEPLNFWDHLNMWETEKVIIVEEETKQLLKFS